MYCKWCGMDSKDDSRCEWCGRPFATANGQQATTAVPPQTATIAPQSPQQPVPPPVYTPPVAEPTVIPPLVYTPKPENEESAPQPNYAGSPVETTVAMQAPPAQTIATAPAPPPVPRASDPRERAAQRAAEYGDYDNTPVLLPFWWRLERYLGIMLPLLAIGMFFSHMYSNYYLVPFFALLFPSGILMGSFRVVGYYDDEFVDALLLLGLSAVFGPVYGTALYAIVGLIKQEINPSLMGLMASYLVMLFATGSAAGGWEDVLEYMLAFRFAFDPISWVIQIFPLTLLLGGWACASFSRPLNE